MQAKQTIQLFLLGGEINFFFPKKEGSRLVGLFSDTKLRTGWQKMSQKPNQTWWPAFVFNRIRFLSSSVDYYSLVCCCSSLYFAGSHELTFVFKGIIPPNLQKCLHYKRMKLVHCNEAFRLNPAIQWPPTLTFLSIETSVLPVTLCFPQSLRVLSLKCTSLCDYRFHSLIHLQTLEVRGLEDCHSKKLLDFPPMLKQLVYHCWFLHSCEQELYTIQDVPGSLQGLDVCGKIRNILLPSDLQSLACMDYIATNDKPLPQSLTRLELRSNFAQAHTLGHLTNLTSLLCNTPIILPSTVVKLQTLTQNVPYFLNTAHILCLDLSSTRADLYYEQWCNIDLQFPCLNTITFSLREEPCLLRTLKSLGMLRLLGPMPQHFKPALAFRNLTVECSQSNNNKTGRFSCRSCDQQTPFCFCSADITQIQNNMCSTRFEARCSLCASSEGICKPCCVYFRINR